MYATYPLKFLTPRLPFSSPHQTVMPPSVVFILGYGGGLLAHDFVKVVVKTDPGAIGIITTQASTKVYKSFKSTTTSIQHLKAKIQKDSLLAIVPDQITCFKKAKYRQRQSYHLESTGNLLLLDWLSSGRSAPPRSERWQFSHYDSSVEIFLAGSLLCRDHLLLDNENSIYPCTPASSSLADQFPVAHKMGRMNVYGNIFLIGPLLFETAAHAHQEIDRQPIISNASTMWACSWIQSPGGATRVYGSKVDPPVGLLIKFASVSVWAAKDALRDLLDQHLKKHVFGNTEVAPWSRI